MDMNDIEEAKQNAVEWLGDSIAALFDRYSHRAIDFSAGRNRATFIFPTYVVKLPRNGDGVCDNDWEGSISNGPDSSPDDVQYARTRLHYVGDIPVLFMERILEADYAEITRVMGYVPDWVGSVDCGQVGWNKEHKLLAYDYGWR